MQECKFPETRLEYRLFFQTQNLTSIYFKNKTRKYKITQLMLNNVISKGIMKNLLRECRVLDNYLRKLVLGIEIHCKNDFNSILSYAQMTEISINHKINKYVFGSHAKRCLKLFINFSDDLNFSNNILSHCYDSQDLKKQNTKVKIKRKKDNIIVRFFRILYEQAEISTFIKTLLVITAIFIAMFLIVTTYRFAKASIVFFAEIPGKTFNETLIWFIVAIFFVIYFIGFMIFSIYMIMVAVRMIKLKSKTYVASVLACLTSIIAVCIAVIPTFIKSLFQRYL